MLPILITIAFLILGTGITVCVLGIVYECAREVVAWLATHFYLRLEIMPGTVVFGVQLAYA